jgi:hypothetical protein
MGCALVGQVSQLVWLVYAEVENLSYMLHSLEDLYVAVITVEVTHVFMLLVEYTLDFFNAGKQH